MSLQVWLPLNGNLENQGLADIIVTNSGATVDNSGKIGKCYSFSGDGSKITFPYTLSSATAYTVCIWLKPIASTIPGCPFMFETGNYWQFGIYNNNITLRDLSTTVSGSRKSYSLGTIVANQWTHIACSYNAGEVKIYRDGILLSTNNTGGNAMNTYSGTVAGISEPGYNTASYYYNGSVNDFRIYDHALSPMEIKRISQGLVLHYPLNRNGCGQENLIMQTMIDAEPWKSAISGTYAIDGKTGWILSNNQLYSKSGNGANNIFSGLTYEENTQYTISFKWRDDYRTDGKSSSLYIRFKYSDGTYSQVISSKDYNYWKEEIMTSTAGKTVSAITTTYGNGGNLLFTDLKLEKGAIKTSTSPIVNSDLYNSMGLNSTTEYDCSGFCNNGTRTGTFSWTSDTPKYSVSSMHTGSNYIYLDSPPTETKTIAVWAKWNTIPSGQSVILVDNGSGIGLGLMSTGILCSTSGAGSSNTFSKTNLVANTWYHFVIVKTGTTTRKLYINGVEQTATSNTSNWSYSVNQLQLGKRSTTSDGFAGKLSDFRAYTTALSADDVKALYENSAYVATDGTMYAYEFVEE